TQRATSVRIFLSRGDEHRPLHSFPTRRSSDLSPPKTGATPSRESSDHPPSGIRTIPSSRPHGLSSFSSPGKRWAIGTCSLRASRDRKSTRLNSSHVKISYAVFCLKKKKKHRVV